MEGFAPHPGPWACKNRMRQQTSRNTSGRWPQLSGVPSSCGGRVEQWVQGLVQGRLTNTGVVFHLIMPVLFELHVRTWLERCSVWWSGEGSRKAAQTKSDKKTLKDSPASSVANKAQKKVAIAGNTIPPLLIKHLKIKLRFLLLLLPVLRRQQSHIALDLVTSIPPSTGNTAILTIIEWTLWYYTSCPLPWRPQSY